MALDRSDGLLAQASADGNLNKQPVWLVCIHTRAACENGSNHRRGVTVNVSNLHSHLGGDVGPASQLLSAIYHVLSHSAC